jgi:HSP20 family protein
VEIRLLVQMLLEDCPSRPAAIRRLMRMRLAFSGLGLVINEKGHYECPDVQDVLAERERQPVIVADDGVDKDDPEPTVIEHGLSKARRFIAPIMPRRVFLHEKQLFSEIKIFGTRPLTVPKCKPNRSAVTGGPIANMRPARSRQAARSREDGGANMIATFADPFSALFNLQRALDGRLMSDWLEDQTASQGPFPPINVFQQGDDILAIIELPGVEKSSIAVQAKENTVRVAGKKAIAFPETASVHRRERLFGEFDRTLSLPIQINPDQIKAEYRDGILAIHLPRAENDRPRTIKIS